MPCAIFDYIGAFLRNGFALVDNVIPVIKTIIRLLLSNHTGTLRNLNPASGTYTNTRRNSSEPSGTFRTLPPEPTPTPAGTLPPEPSKTFRNQPFGTFRNLLPREPTPAYTGTLRNLPEPSGNLPPEPIPFYTRTLRNLPRPASGTYTSIRRNPPEPSGNRLRNPPPETTPAHAGTLRNLPEPSSGTCSCDPHRHTPELIWAEDPISLRCWGKIEHGGLKLWWSVPTIFWLNCWMKCPIITAFEHWEGGKWAKWNHWHQCWVAGKA